MKKILIITSGLTAGGVESLLLNIIDEADKNQYKFDILIPKESLDNWEYKFKKYGCNVLRIPRVKNQGYLKAIRAYKKIITVGEYDIVHSQTGFAGVLPMIAGTITKKCKLICHSHFDNYQYPKITKIFARILLRFLPCKKLACSYGAGYELYGRRGKFDFVKNGIDSRKFAYNPQLRQEIRAEWGIGKNDFVLGTVGRMQYQKNHEFLVRIFKEVQKRDNNSKLVLIGDGELREDIKKQVEGFGLSDSVMFLGNRNDVYRLLNGMDIFIMPTRFEGLSLALLEVQCAGLPCLTTNVVPKEAKVTEAFHFLSLDLPAEEWADVALKYQNHDRTDGSDAIRASGFDKVTAAETWLAVYDKL